MWALRILVLAAVLTTASHASALPTPAPVVGQGSQIESVQAFCGPFRCFARPVWRYRSGAGFRPYRHFDFPAARPRFAPFGFRRFGPPGGFGGFRRF